MNFTDERIQRYAEKHTTAEGDALKSLSRFTHAHVMNPRMLSGHLQGRLLSMISKLLKPACILEIGTYTGYSAICLAEGLIRGGKLISIDSNPELEDVARKFIGEAGMKDRISLITGDAYQVIRTLDQHYDLVFIDADKENYSRYYDLVFDRLHSGGVIIADNVLWSGKILDEKALSSDKDTKALAAFNKKIQEDDRVENILLPVRDGLMIIRKI